MDRSPRQPNEAIAPARSVSGAAFWALMDRWGVTDVDALCLVEGPPLTANGKRPRFRLTGSQVDVFQQLREIDRLCTDLYGDDAPSWLARPNNAPVFSRRSPLAHMVQHRNGIVDALHHLARQAFRVSLGATTNAPAPQRRKARSQGMDTRRKP